MKSFKQYKEELKGNQHKLDHNKNGKLDADDFKKLRSKKKVEESDASYAAGKEKEKEKNLTPKDQNTLARLRSMMAKEKKPVKEDMDTVEKNEMAETQLHFIKYAALEILEYIKMGGRIEEWYQNKLSKVQSDVESLHSYIEGEKRRTGMVAEDVEELDELSKSTLASYAKAATKDARISQKIAKDFERHELKSRKPELKAGAKLYKDVYQSKAFKRETGVNKAIDRLAKEEVELDEGMKPYVSSTPPKFGEKGSHDVMDKDGKVVKSYPHTPEGMKAAKEHLKKMHEEVELDEATPTKQQVKQGIGIARDKRYAGGNVTGAVKAMNKVNKGLAQHPAVKKELQKQNEENELTEDHFKIGDTVRCKESGMTGKVVKLDKPSGKDDEEYYTVKRSDGKTMKYAPNELTLMKEDLDEKIDLTKAKMGDVIKDFQASDAPQFAGKSKEKRKEMAIAAKLEADRGVKEDVGMLSFKQITKLHEVAEVIEEAMIGFSEFQQKIADQQKAGNKIVDKQYKNDKAFYVVVDKEGIKRKYVFTQRGRSVENMGKTTDSEKPKSKPEEKRGRGRPKGSASGARVKGSSKSDDDEGLDDTRYSLNLPNRR